MAYIGAEPLPGQNREVDDISSGFNGNATAFTLQVNGLNVSPETANNILVNIGGVIQNPGTDYTIAASTITFTTAPASGLSFFGIILGAGINTATVADDTIGPSKLIDTAVTAGSYTTADITVDAQGRVTAAASGSISNAEIANNAVTTAKIADSTGASDGVTTAKLATDAVTAAKLADNAVVNASVDASAAIAGTKISPDFGSQAISTTNDSVTIGDSIIHSGDTNTKIRFPAADTITAETGGVERLRINSTGQTLVGDSVAQLSTSSERPFQVNSVNGPKIAIGRNDTSISAGNTIGGIEFYGNDSDGAFKNCAGIFVTADDAHSTNSKATRMEFHTTVNNSATATEKIRINDAGGLCVGNGVLSSNLDDGNIVVDEGIYIGTFNGDNQIRSNSAGGGSASLFIGNAQIQVSSDERIKKDVVNTVINATEELKKIRVVDFTWNDPKDMAYNNKNARGKWTGAIAQEMVNVFPYIINAPRKEDTLEIDYESERNWLVEYGNLVPILIKSIQELSAKVETLETKVAALEAA